METIETDRPALIAALLANGTQLVSIAYALGGIEDAIDRNTRRMTEVIKRLELTISQMDL